MRIRRATLVDLDAVHRLEVESFPSEAWPRYVFQEDLARANSIYLIAEVDEVTATCEKTSERMENAATEKPTEEPTGIESAEPTQSISMRAAQVAEVVEPNYASPRVPGERIKQPMKSTHLNKPARHENQDSRVAGYISCGFSVVQAFCHISSFAVALDQRDQGVGGLLLDDLLELTADLGIYTWRAETRLSNAASLHLFESRGFKRIGIMKEYYAQPLEDGILLTKTVK